MDPLTVTTVVIKASAACLATAKTMYDLRAKYKDAPMYIVSMCSETTVIGASLSKVQSLFLRQSDLPSLLESRPELVAALDAALTGCMVLFSYLDNEMQHIMASSSQGVSLAWRAKARMVWNRDKLRELLEALRGLQTSLNLLIQLLQVDSLAEIKKLVEKGRPALAQTAQRTQSLRLSNSQIDVPESIFSKNDDGVASVLGDRPGSIWLEREFDFDDLVINSQVYRRALAAARAGKQPVSLPDDQLEAYSDLIDLSDDVKFTQGVYKEPSIDGATQDLVGLLLAGEPKSNRDDQTNDHENAGPSGKPNVSAAPPVPTIMRAQRANTDVVEPASKTATSSGEAVNLPIASLLLRISPDPVVESQALRKDSMEIRRKPVTSAGSGKICYKCKQAIHGKYIRFRGTAVHLECFTCDDCGKPISKFFPSGDEDSEVKCETCYFRALDLICHNCGGALRNQYVLALGKKYHIEHFTCSVCSTTFGADSEYYEHEDNAYCLYHYSVLYAQHCPGCLNAILKQFIEILRDGRHENWHWECYMIRKYWKVQLSTYIPQVSVNITYLQNTKETSEWLRSETDTAEKRVFKIWSVLSNFEERSVNFISEISVHNPNGEILQIISGFAMFIEMIDKYVDAISSVNELLVKDGLQKIQFSREVKLLCKNLVALLYIIVPRKTEITDELPLAISGTASYLKLLIRLGLQAALKGSAIDSFLDGLGKKQQFHLEKLSRVDEIRALADPIADTCALCKKITESSCFRHLGLTYHPQCVTCPQCHQFGTYVSVDEAFERCKSCSAPHDPALLYVDCHKQSVHLLQVALARFILNYQLNLIEFVNAYNADRSLAP